MAYTLYTNEEGCGGQWLSVMSLSSCSCLGLFALVLVLERILYFFKNYYKCATQDVFCILIHQLLKFWKIKFESAKPYFLK